MKKQSRTLSKIRAASILLLLTAVILFGNSPCSAFREWGKIDIYVPKNASPLEKSIIRLAESGKPDEALLLTNKAIKSEKNIAGLLLIRIKLYGLLLQDEKVTADLKQLLNLPLECDQLYHAVDMADSHDEIEIGIQLGQRYIKEFGTAIPQPTLLTARMYSKLKQYDKAEKLLLLIIGNPMFSDFSYPELSRVYVYWNKPEKLIAIATTALNKPKSLTEKSKIVLRTMRAQAYLETAKYKEALGDYNILIAKAPELRELYKLRAKALTGLGQHKLAEADRQKQKELDNLDN